MEIGRERRKCLNCGVVKPQITMCLKIGITINHKYWYCEKCYKELKKQGKI